MTVPQTQSRLSLTIRDTGGQILGGAINLGINAHNNKAGKVSYAVYLVFIALQALAPFAGFLLNSPGNVQRTDGIKVNLKIHGSILHETKATAKLFFTRNVRNSLETSC